MDKFNKGVTVLTVSYTDDKYEIYDYDEERIIVCTDFEFLKDEVRRILGNFNEYMTYDKEYRLKK